MLWRCEGLKDDVVVVKLTENDVPGAKLRSSTVEDHSVTELRRWLTCRGLKTTGAKPSLVRLKSCTCITVRGPPNGSVDCRWGIKNDIQPISRFILELIQGHTTVIGGSSRIQSASACRLC